jgi:hypothetical protein
MFVSLMLVILVLGLLLILHGLRGQPGDGKARCGRCSFDLEGHRSGASDWSGVKCPECGNDLHIAGAVRIVQRRKGWVGIGIGVLLLLIAGSGVVAQKRGMLTRVTFLRIIPSTMLAGYIQTDDPSMLEDVIGVLDSRIVNPVIDGKIQNVDRDLLRAAADAALRRRLSGNLAWDPRLTTYVEIGFETGALSDQQVEDFLFSCWKIEFGEAYCVKPGEVFAMMRLVRIPASSGKSPRPKSERLWAIPVMIEFVDARFGGEALVFDDPTGKRSRYVRMKYLYQLDQETTSIGPSIVLPVAISNQTDDLRVKFRYRFDESMVDVLGLTARPQGSSITGLLEYPEAVRVAGKMVTSDRSVEFVERVTIHENKPDVFEYVTEEQIGHELRSHCSLRASRVEFGGDSSRKLIGVGLSTDGRNPPVLAALKVKDAYDPHQSLGVTEVILSDGSMKENNPSVAVLEAPRDWNGRTIDVTFVSTDRWERYHDTRVWKAMNAGKKLRVWSGELVFKDVEVR